MNGRQVKMLRRQARKESKKLEAAMVPEFKHFVNTQFSFRERLLLAWRILWRRF